MSPKKIAYRILAICWILFGIYMMISFAVDPAATIFAIVFVFGTLVIVWGFLYLVERMIKAWLK